MSNNSPPQTDSGLICSQISVSYPEFRLNIDFSIASGEFVSIVGPSGCGKSTTLQLICGLFQPETGTISLNGKDITTLPVWEREIGMVFQDYALFPHLDVSRNIAYPLRLRKLRKAERRARVDSLLDLVGLTGYGRRRIQSLSGGEQQRVALARAIASSPRLLLLDEPLSALDAKMRVRLREELLHIQKQTGITTIYVTHDQDEALSMSDRIIVMNQGGIEQVGTPEDVYSRPATLHAALFMGDGTVMPYSIIPDTIVTPTGHYEFIYREQKGEHLVFFRPEHVTVHDDPLLPFPEFLAHARFSDARILSCEYTGFAYRLHCIWKEHQITALSTTRPHSESVSLGVRLRNLVEYSDGLLV
ncbi:ABC transporter ATP-binding protein [Parasphaerochaeta coccoides]|uniref:Fe(3+)-transporting ATPase n=1 Tax=Parasphaerochaeta coccoides (strain ATCC BAA-1237 / DSM 17374 / SPN1) TaxID=760011 RepID=F4GIN2_PARC1|nr:ABC transporter ATP-binding protein [Parasphaerochaeta coccoides]AEC02166.1 Fe(3+)-transporting ATPase [Parasphaerochaeta coccoides DSM 17374]